MATIIDGNKISDRILARLVKQSAPKTELAAILVGDDPASLSFLRQKERTARLLTARFKLYRLSASLSQDGLERAVAQVAARKSVGGVIVHLPLPAMFDRVAVLNVIPIAKDIDVLNGENSRVLAPAAGALEKILRATRTDIASARAVVIGAGLLIGRPVATWLMGRAATLTVLRSSSPDTSALKKADIVVTGIGTPGWLRGNQLKRGSVVVDFGYGRARGTVSGDADFPSCRNVAGWITPTPGGTGPIVVAKLFENFYALAGKNLTKR